MKKGNIIDFLIYRNGQIAKENHPPLKISDELKIAIQTLIHRLREQRPINISK